MYDRLKLAAVALFISLVPIFGCQGLGGTKPDQRPNDFPISSFVEINALYEGKPAMSGSGSIVGNTEKGAYILTVAHVCKPSAFINDDDVDFDKMKIMIGKNTEKMKEAVRVKVNVRNDICLMFAEGVNRPAMPIADEAPERGEQCYSMSSPYGISSGTTVPIFDGRYAGKRGIPLSLVDKKIVDTYAIPGAPGSSGGPIFNKKGEVIGVTSLGLRRFESLTISPTWEQLDEFITEFRD